MRLRPMRSIATWRCNILPQVMSSTSHDDFHFSETTEIFFWDESSDTVPSYLHDAEISDDTIGRALSSPLLTQEREEPADRRQAYHSLKKVCCQVSPCLSVV